MNSQTTQIKLTLPLALRDFIESKASKFGVPITTYIRHVLLKDVEDLDYPTFEASDRTIRAYKKAMREKSKAIEITDLEEYFKNL